MKIDRQITEKKINQFMCERNCVDLAYNLAALAASVEELQLLLTKHLLDHDMSQDDDE